MCAQVLTGDVHGLYRVQMGLVSDDGLNYGTAVGTPAAETELPAYISRYAKSAEFPIPDRTVIDFTGGDVWTGSFVHGITSLGTFEMRFSTVDATFIALASQSKVDQTTNSRWTIYGENIMLSSPPQMWLAVTYRLQSKDVGTKGANRFITTIIPRCWVEPKGVSGAPSFQAAGEYVYRVIPTIGEKLPHGLAFTANKQGFADNETPAVHVITNNPIHFVGFIAGEGATSTITLPYLPVGTATDYTSPDSDTQPVQVVVDGVVTDATTVNPATGEVAVATTKGQYVGIMYETTFQTAA